MFNPASHVRAPIHVPATEHSDEGPAATQATSPTVPSSASGNTGKPHASTSSQKSLMGADKQNAFLHAVHNKFKTHATLKNMHPQTIIRLVQQGTPTPLSKTLVAERAELSQQKGIQYEAKRRKIHDTDVVLLFGSRNGIVTDARIADESLIAAIYGTGHGTASASASPSTLTSFSELLSFPAPPDDSSDSGSAHTANTATPMQPVRANPSETISARRQLPSLPPIKTSIEPTVATQSATWSPAQPGGNSGEVPHSAAMQSLTKTLDKHSSAVASMDSQSPETPGLLRRATHLLGSAMQRRLLSGLNASEFQRISIDNIEDVHSAQDVITEFKKILTNRTKQYRMNVAEQEQFVDAFKRMYNDDEEDLDIGAQVYAQECEQVRAIVDEHPELKGIPIEGLVAIREWTGDKLWKKVQDIFEQEVTEDNWESLLTNLPLAKAIISGLNTLPESYTYKGTVYTGEDQSAEWLEQRYKGKGKNKEPFIDFRFFATSKTEEGKWQNRNVNWETESVTGKWIKVLSKAPHEDEVLLSPGTGRKDIELTQLPGGSSDYPNTLIRQKQHL